MPTVGCATTVTVDVLLTISSANGFEPSLFDELAKQPNSGLLVTPFRITGKQAYNIYIRSLKKRFYIIVKDNNIFSGSFSQEQIGQSLSNKSKSEEESFILLSEQQNANLLANLYINYNQLSPLFDQLFKNKNNDVFKSLRLFGT